MRNLSTEFKERQNSGNRNYLKYADFTFTDGSTLSITDKDLWSNGFKFEDAVSQNGSFDIGAAIINKLTLQINNFSGKYTDYIWDGARVVCYIGLELSTGIEKIRICTMTVTDAPYQSTAIISLTCEDSMRLFDRDYSESKLSYPATRLQIIQDACEVCGVTLQSTRFDNDDFVIQNRPDDSSITFRQVIAWVAQMGCQWAKCDEYGRLCFGWYEREVPDNFYDLCFCPEVKAPQTQPRIPLKQLTVGLYTCGCRFSCGAVLPGQAFEFWKASNNNFLKGYRAVHTRADLSVQKPCIAVSHPASIEVSPVCLGSKKKDP